MQIIISVFVEKKIKNIYNFSIKILFSWLYENTFNHI